MRWVTDRRLFATMFALKAFEEGDEVKIKPRKFIGAGADLEVYQDPTHVHVLSGKHHWYFNDEFIAFADPITHGIWITHEDIVAWRRPKRRRRIG